MTNPEKTSEENDIEEEANGSNGVEENIDVNTESCQQTNTDGNEENTEKQRYQNWSGVVYKCSQCKYSNPDERNYNQHLRKHTKETPYQCKMCGE